MGVNKEALLEISNDKEEAMEILDNEKELAISSYIKIREHILRITLR